MEGLLGFALAALALAGSPGPATLSLAATGAAFGARRGFAYFAGINLGMLFVIAITASGVTGLILALPGATPIVVALSAAYFVYLAYRIATAPPLTEDPQGREPSFLGGVFLSAVNPKGYAAMAALFSGFALFRDNLALDLVVKVIALMVIIVAVNTAWLFAGAALTRFFRDPWMNRVVNVTFAILLLASIGFALMF